MVSEGAQQSFLMETKWLNRFLDVAKTSHDDVVFLVGGGNGQLAAALEHTSRVVTVEPDESIANYLYSLELYKNMVINAEPSLVLGDIPFDHLLCLQPELMHEGVLAGMLKISFKRAALLVPEPLLAVFNARHKLGTLLRAAYAIDVGAVVPKSAFSPALEFPSVLVSLVPLETKNPVSLSLQLLMHEAGTMRGLLTRSCREYFGYTLADAQGAVRVLDSDVLKKHFWELSDDDFKDVCAWLRQG
jgi:16S rRNA A1518/A1519 N6-dimethyltransferase RsmA/KsgA/DIM1 with predicted DNA glycosylase/AP lyase activity